MKTQLTLAGYYPVSYPLHFLGICLTLITACSVLKEKSFYQADSLRRDDIKTQAKIETIITGQAFRISSSSDSSDRLSYAQIFPKGNFKYSIVDGYSGEAEQIIIHERVLERKRQTESAGLTETSKANANIQASAKASTRIRSKEKVLDANNVVLLFMGGCLLLSLIIFGGIKRIRF